MVCRVALARVWRAWTLGGLGGGANAAGRASDVRWGSIACRTTVCACRVRTLALHARARVGSWDAVDADERAETEGEGYRLLARATACERVTLER